MNTAISAPSPVRSFTSFLQRFYRKVLDTITAVLQRKYAAAIVLCMLLIYVSIAGLERSSRKHFWYDEVCTIAVVTQGSVHAMWGALAHAADTNPPGFYLIEGLFSQFSSDNHIGYRVPALLGFLVVPVCLYLFVKRQAGIIAGLISATMTLVSPLLGIHSIEARPYGLLCGLIAIAMLVWQRAPSRAQGPLLAILFAGATCLHYYAVLAFVPFIIAEAARWLRLRKLRIGVWIALFCGFLPLAAFWPLLAGVKQVYGANFWAKPAVQVIIYCYYYALSPRGGRWALPVIVVLLAVVLLGVAAHLRRPKRGSNSIGFPQEEAVLVLGFCCLPIIAYVFAMLSHGGMTPRYVLPMVLGLCALTGIMAARSDSRTATCVLIAITSIAAVQEYRDWRADTRLSAMSSLPPEMRIFDNLVQDRDASGLPVVVSNGLDYLPLAYYSLVHHTSSPMSIIDARQATAFIGTDSIDRALSILRHYLPLRVQEFSNFAALNHEFLLYSSGGSEWDWWPARLKKDGYSLSLLKAEQGRKLFLVDQDRNNKTSIDQPFPKGRVSPAWTSSIR